MLPNPVYHALVLNLHQPWGNFDQLLNTPGKQWKAKEILFAYDRIPRAVEGMKILLAYILPYPAVCWRHCRIRSFKPGCTASSSAGICSGDFGIPAWPCWEPVTITRSCR
jgi:hypothetical protein